MSATPAAPLAAPRPTESLTCRAGRMVGADGLATTLLLSNLMILMSAGVTLAWVLGRVYRVARRAAPAPLAVDVAMVLGFRLRGQQVAQQYAERLLRASVLHKRGSIRRILVLGGRTGGAAGCSEAEQGRRFLISQGVTPDCVLAEEDSIHTLENLRNARAAVDDGSAPVVLIQPLPSGAECSDGSRLWPAAGAVSGGRPPGTHSSDRLAPAPRSVVPALVLSRPHLVPMVGQQEESRQDLVNPQ